MTREERAVQRCARKEARDEVLSWKRAAWAAQKTMTPEELKADNQRIINEFHAGKLKMLQGK
jgi:hypothetical protein